MLRAELLPHTLVWLLAGLIGAAIASLPSTGFGEQTPAVTIWDGVYTPAQAERGRATYERVCSYCHRSNLTGGEAPSLKESFLLGWRNRPLGELVRYVVNNMPQGSPGIIGEQDYLDVISFVLKSNLVPASGVELRRDTFDLEQIRITEGPDGATPRR